MVTWLTVINQKVLTYITRLTEPTSPLRVLQIAGIPVATIRAEEPMGLCTSLIICNISCVRVLQQHLLVSMVTDDALLFLLDCLPLCLIDI